MKLAYFINRYPMPSMTYIRREIRVLERMGFPIQRFALEPWAEDLVDERDKREAEKTRYVKSGGILFFIVKLLTTMLLRPMAFTKACLLSLRLARASDRSFFYHLAYLAEACILRDWLVAAQIDHLHVHFGTNPAEIGMLAHVLGGPPYSITVHGSEEFERAPCLSHHEKIKRSRFTVTVSSYGCSQLMRWCHFSDWHKLNVIHCSADDSHLETIPEALPDNETIVCVGRLCEQKGHLLLIQAIAQLVNEGVNIKLRLVGDGPLRPHLEAAIAQHNLQDHVVITGWATGDQVRQEILAARAFVLTSFAENLPVVLMEALALERPVVSTYIAGIPELVIPGNNGWLVPAGSQEAIVAVLREVMSTPAPRLREMGKAGRRRVCDRHNATTETLKLLALLSAYNADGQTGGFPTAEPPASKSSRECGTELQPHATVTRLSRADTPV